MSGKSMKNRINRKIYEILPDVLLYPLLRIKLARLGVLKLAKIASGQGKKPVYKIVEFSTGHSLYVSRLKRVYKYRNGIQARKDLLKRKYFMGEDTLIDIDLFCDVGANIGEVTTIFKEFRPYTTCLTVEPDKVEIEALNLNLKEVMNFPFFLDSTSSVRQVKFSNDSGDTRIINEEELTSSSFIEKKLQKLTKVPTATLDQILNTYKFHSGFLKLEAEGFEPEVLLGGKNSLQAFKFVAIDTSRERYSDGEFVSSFERCNEILGSFGFNALYVELNSSLFVREYPLPLSSLTLKDENPD